MGTLLAGGVLTVVSSAPARLHTSHLAPAVGKAAAGSPVPQLIRDVKTAGKGHQHQSAWVALVQNRG